MNAAGAIEALLSHGWRVVTCESVTAGLLCSSLTSVPGSSAVVDGGFVTYSAELKQAWAHVPSQLLREHGLVSEATALAMAQGVLAASGADVAVGITGAAGPTEHDGVPVGTVCCAISGPRGDQVESWKFSGDREAVRRAAADEALRFLWNYCSG